MKRIIQIAIFILFSTGVAWGQGAAGGANLKLKSMFVYNFIKNVEWPSSQKSGDFNVTVLGDKDLYQMMNSTYAGKEINGQKIVFSYVDAYSEVGTAHILYIAPKFSSDLAKYSQKLRKNKTLVVSDKGGLLYDGSVINFVVSNNKLLFEISKSNAELVPLTIGPSLLKMATTVI
ncbi:YfiR family protein [Parvicella tangerina]|uniref:YfiR family protein n=1 Tax=Parvicella tangerina TaxID=2829795 RepID=A0A916NJ43_9FLAO|nr:YfiR family protein [Parvicella tangerina]CAG5086240.1 hypothetical protein CRYO30217_03055 [Parvicella tangerina]